jgi:hypothetical protein
MRVLVLALLAAFRLATEIRASEFTAHPDRVKAAFVIQFVKFIDWPENASLKTPIIIGVTGKDGVSRELQTMAAGKKINGRALVVEELSNPDLVPQVHVLYLSRSEDEALSRWLASVRGTAVLTVGESQAFMDQGGMIRFIPRDGKLRFAINAETARQAGLKLSAQLRKLAVDP